MAAESLHPNARAVLDTLVEEVHLNNSDLLEEEIRKIFKELYQTSGKAPTATEILNYLKTETNHKSNAYGNIAHAIETAKELSTKISIETVFKTPHVNIDTLRAALIKALCEASGLFPCDIEIKIDGIDE